MFIAHLPAGYLLTHFLQISLHTKKYLWLGLAASLLPDLDLLYFYLIDHRQTLHHEYWTHLPMFWLPLCLLSLVIALALKHRHLLAAAAIFFANIFLHLVLDTFVGRVPWLYPFSDRSYYLVTVPARYPFWVENFIFHWTFLVELIIVISALTLLLYKPAKRK